MNAGGRATQLLRPPANEYKKRVKPEISSPAPPFRWLTPFGSEWALRARCAKTSWATSCATGQRDLQTSHINKPCFSTPPFSASPGALASTCGVPMAYPWRTRGVWNWPKATLPGLDGRLLTTFRKVRFLSGANGQAPPIPPGLYHSAQTSDMRPERFAGRIERARYFCLKSVTRGYWASAGMGSLLPFRYLFRNQTV